MIHSLSVELISRENGSKKEEDNVPLAESKEQNIPTNKTETDSQIQRTD